MLNEKHEHTEMRESGAEPFAPTVRDFYEKDVVCLTPEDSIYDAAKLMLSHHVGDIVITAERDGRVVPVGIITDRDIVVGAVAKGADLTQMKISEILKTGIVTATEEHALSELVQMMVTEGISRLPIVNDYGALKGILSSKRLFQYFAQGLCELTELSQQQKKREKDFH